MSYHGLAKASKSKKTKYYAVGRGRETGIFTNWEACRAAVRGYSSPIFKSFNSRAEAEAALVEWAEPESPIPFSVVVDAACRSNPGPIEWQGFYLDGQAKRGEVLFQKGPMGPSTNNVGEFLALVDALALCHGKETVVYSDSMTAMAWVRDGACNTAIPVTEPLLSLVAAAERWLKEHPAPTRNRILQWRTDAWGENPADYGRK